MFGHGANIAAVADRAVVDSPVSPIRMRSPSGRAARASRIASWMVESTRGRLSPCTENDHGSPPDCSQMSACIIFGSTLSAHAAIPPSCRGLAIRPISVPAGPGARGKHRGERRALCFTQAASPDRGGSGAALTAPTADVPAAGRGIAERVVGRSTVSQKPARIKSYCSAQSPWSLCSAWLAIGVVRKTSAGFCDVPPARGRCLQRRRSVAPMRIRHVPYVE